MSLIKIVISSNDEARAAICANEIAERMKAFLKEGNKLTVFNTLGFERNDVVNLGDVDVFDD